MTVAHQLEVLPFASMVALLRGAPWRRVAVIGDSVAEGVRDPHDGYSDLSWVDRITDALRAVVPGLTVMNAGRRNLRAAQVRARQLGPALAFEPDLAILAAGGNDALGLSYRPDRLAGELDAIAGPLRDAGADLLMIELMDIVASGLVPEEHATALDTRMRSLAEVTRVVADRHDATLVEMRRHPVCTDPGVYASDRLHLNARGHAIVGSEAVLALSAALAQRRARPPYEVELTDDEVLEDLCWPNPPPGRWALPEPRG